MRLLSSFFKKLAGCWMDDRMDAILENTLDNEVIYDEDGNVLWQKYISWN